jgi:hypothetical protein
MSAPRRCRFFAKPRPARLDNSENGIGPIDITLGEYADQLGVHCSDALAEWLAVNGTRSSVMVEPQASDEELVRRLLKDPQTIANLTDSAHIFRRSVRVGST